MICLYGRLGAKVREQARLKNHHLDKHSLESSIEYHIPHPIRHAAHLQMPPRRLPFLLGQKQKIFQAQQQEVHNPQREANGQGHCSQRR